MGTRRISQSLSRRVNLRRYFIFLVALIPLFCATFVVAQDLDAIRSNISSGNIELQRNALIEIRKLRTAEASRLAIALLADRNEILRASSANAVIYLPRQEAASLLLPLLNDKAEFVRQEAAYALGDVGDASAVTALKFAIEKDSDPVRNAAIVALGKVGDYLAIYTLTDLLKRKPTEDNAFTLRAAAHSIGQIAEFQEVIKDRQAGPTRMESLEFRRNAVSVLIRVLKDEKQTDDTRREAAFALGALRDKSAIPVLEKNVSSSDPHLVEICKDALAKLHASM